MPESDVSVTKVGCICNKLGLAGEINNGQARCKRDALATELTALLFLTTKKPTFSILISSFLQQKVYRILLEQTMILEQKV